MKTIKFHFTKLIPCFILFIIFTSLTNAASYTWDGVGPDFKWSTSTNWTSDTIPGSSDTAIIGDASSNRTIYFDSTTSTLSTLNLTQTTTNTTNTLSFIKSLTITNNITLGNGSDSSAKAEFLFDASANQNTAAGVNATIQIGNGGTRPNSPTGTGSLTLNTGGVLALQAYKYNGTASGTTLNSNLTISGGSLINLCMLLGGTGATNSAQNTISGALTMSSGSITIYGGTTANDDENRIVVAGDFSMTGGSLTFYSDSTYTRLGNTLFLLQGASNQITGGTVTGNGLIGLWASNINQTFSSSAHINNLWLRNYGNYTKTIYSTYNTSGTDKASYTTIYLTQSTANAVGTLQLGSDISAQLLNAYYWAASGTTGNAIDLNGHTLSLQNNTTGSATSWSPLSNSATSISNYFITNTGTADGYFVASTFDFTSGTAATEPGKVNVGYSSETADGATLVASTGKVILKATGVGSNDLGGNGSINPTSKFWYTGNGSSTLTSNRNIGKLELGNGSISSTLRLISTSSATPNAFTAAGTVKVNSSSILDLNGLKLNIGTSTTVAYLSGSGTIKSTASGASVAFDGTGGLSPGGNVDSDENGIGLVGTLTFDSSTVANMGGGVTLASTSNSYFDIVGSSASTSNYDRVNLNGVSITYNGTLNLNFQSYTPTIGESYILFLNQGASSSSTFTSIVSNRGEYSFLFDSATGTLTVTAIPEPSTVFLVAIGTSLLFLSLRRKNYLTT